MHVIKYFIYQSNQCNSILFVYIIINAYEMTQNIQNIHGIQKEKLSDFSKTMPSVAIRFSIEIK